MSPELKAELDAKIASVVFPSWEHLPSDQVTHSMTYSEGYHYSSWTFEDPSLRLEFRIERAGLSGFAYETYEGEDMARIWKEIMS